MAIGRGASIASDEEAMLVGSKRKATRAFGQKESVRRCFEKLFNVEKPKEDAPPDETIEAGAAQVGVQEGRAAGASKGAKRQPEPTKGRARGASKVAKQQPEPRKGLAVGASKGAEQEGPQAPLSCADSSSGPAAGADPDESVFETLAGLGETSSLKAEESAETHAEEGAQTKAEEGAETKAEQGVETKTGDTKTPTAKGAESDQSTKMKPAAETAVGAKPEDIVAEVLFPTVPTEPKCNRCRQLLDPLRAQITGKSGGSWRCSKCNSRAVQVSRLPSWAQLRQHLKEIPAEEAALFWSSTHSAGGRTELAKLCERTLESRRTQSEGSKVEGRYLPLSVYKQMGYDEKAIELRCKDTKEDPIFGTLYRVAIESRFMSSQEDMVNTKRFMTAENMSSSEYMVNTKRLSSQKDGKGPPFSEKPGRTSQGGRPTPAATNASEAVRVKKEADLKLREAEKRSQAGKRDATKVLAKVAPVLSMLEISLKHKKVGHLPEFARGTGTSLLSELKKADSHAKEVMKNKAEWALTLAEVSELCRKATVHTSFIESMLKAAEQLETTA